MSAPSGSSATDTGSSATRRTRCPSSSMRVDLHDEAALDGARDLVAREAPRESGARRDAVTDLARLAALAEPHRDVGRAVRPSTLRCGGSRAGRRGRRPRARGPPRSRARGRELVACSLLLGAAHAGGREAERGDRAGAAREERSMVFGRDTAAKRRVVGLGGRQRLSAIVPERTLERPGLSLDVAVRRSRARLDVRSASACRDRGRGSRPSSPSRRTCGRAAGGGTTGTRRRSGFATGTFTFSGFAAWSEPGP